MRINNPQANISKKSIKSRMWWHLALTFIILALLFLISLLSYNEIINEKKLAGFFDDLKKTDKLLSQLDSTNLEYIKGQESLFKYLIGNNKDDIHDYFASIHNVKNMIDTVQHQVGYLDSGTNAVLMAKEDLNDNQKLSQLVDSLSNSIMQDFGNSSEYKSAVKKLDYDNMDIKTTIETKTSVDSVNKKKLMGRLGDALSGKVEVQKELKEVLMIIEYRNKKSSGSIEEQMNRIVKMATDHYMKELGKVDGKFNQLIKKNQSILYNSNRIKNTSIDILNHYKETLMKQRNILAERYSMQYNKNRVIRLYTLFGIIGLIIALTVAALYLTRTTYRIEEKLVEAKERISDNLMLKNKIVSMISHDIRSPLNIISLYIKQVLKLEKDPQKTAVFDSINYTTSSALLLANRILDFSKGENRNVKIYKDEFKLHDEVNHIVEGFKELAKSKNNQIINVNKVAPSLEVIFDRSKLQQLYFNLLDNAIKSTESGEIEVSSDWRKEEDGRYKFSLKVKDSGMGISEENLEKIFEPFEQISSAKVEKQELGVGLGLYLCKEITELFDGHISVQSKLGKGTTITASVFADKK